MVEKFGVGILKLPAEKVLAWRRVLIAEHENTKHAKVTASKEGAIAALMKSQQAVHRT